MHRIRELLIEWFDAMSRDLPPPDEWFEAALRELRFRLEPGERRPHREH